MSVITVKANRGPNARVRIMRPSEKRSLSRSATRALDVLELFGEAQRPLRAVDIGQTLTMTPSSTNQLLKTMVDSGHLVFTARGKTYLPSPRLGEFAAWLIDAYGAGGALRGLIRDLAEQTGLTVTATTPNDLFMQVIDLVTPVGPPSERGLRISLFGSAIGSAYLATLDPDEIARLARRARIADGEVPDILAAAARIRRDGFADGPSADAALWSIAMAVPRQGMGPPIVLGLAGAPETVRDNRAALCAAMSDAIARWLEITPL